MLLQLDSPYKTVTMNEEIEPIPFHRSNSTSTSDHQKQRPSSSTTASAVGEAFDKVNVMNNSSILTTATEAAAAAAEAPLIRNDFKRTRLDGTSSTTQYDDEKVDQQRRLRQRTPPSHDHQKQPQQQQEQEQDHDNFLFNLFDDIQDANDNDHQSQTSDEQLSKLSERLNVNGVERSRGALDVHGIHDSSDYGLGVVDSNGTDQTQEFLDQMESCIYEIIETRPNSGLAKAVSIDKDYVMAQRILFVQSSPSPTLQKVNEQGSNDGSSSSLQSTQSVKAEGPDDLVCLMGDYFELKYKYFGDHCLARDIALSDLPAEDRHLWKTGFAQVLSDKDSAGRVVTIAFPQLQSDITMETTIRVYMYMYQTLSKDLDAQKNGYIHVSYAVGTPRLYELFRGRIVEHATEFTKLVHSLPLRCRARHILHSDENLDPIIDLLTEEWDIYHICRYREHFVSSHEEALKILPTFGIPRNAVPVCPVKPEGGKDAGDGISIDDVVLLDDNFPQQSSLAAVTDKNKIVQTYTKYYVETDFHLGFVEAIQQHDEEDHQQQYGRHIHQLHTERSIERTNDQKARKVTKQVPKSPQATTDSGSVMIVPGPMDIELGRGAIYQNRTKPGYLRYRFILDDEFERYETTDRQDRADVVSSIIRRLNDAGLRFVRPQRRKDLKDDDTTATTTTASAGGSRPPAVCWEVVSQSVVRDKITHDFRNQRKAMVSWPPVASHM